MNWKEHDPRRQFKHRSGSLPAPRRGPSAPCPASPRPAGPRTPAAGALCSGLCVPRLGYGGGCRGGRTGGGDTDTRGTAAGALPPGGRGSGGGSGLGFPAGSGGGGVGGAVGCGRASPPPPPPTPSSAPTDPVWAPRGAQHMDARRPRGDARRSRAGPGSVLRPPRPGSGGTGPHPPPEGAPDGTGPAALLPPPLRPPLPPTDGGGRPGPAGSRQPTPDLCGAARRGAHPSVQGTERRPNPPCPPRKEAGDL